MCALCFDCDPLRSDQRQDCTTADDAGVYRLEPPSSDVLAVTASAIGFLPQRLQQPIRVASDRETKLDIVLTPGGVSVSGHVVDALGGSVVGASVHVIAGDAKDQRASSAVSDSQGAFRLWAAPGMMNLLATASGYAPARLESVAPAQGLVLALTPGGSVSGLVLSAHDGKPVPDVRVRARASKANGDREDAFAMSDGSGRFSIEGLYPGRFDVAARAEGWRSMQPVGVDVPLGAQVNDVIVRVERAAVIRGRFSLRETQGPCEQGTLALFAERGASVTPAPSGAQRRPDFLARGRRDGQVILEAVPAGRYRVQTTCIGHLPADGPDLLEVSAADLSELEWTFRSGQSVRVTVRGTSGNPLSGIWISLSKLNGDDPANETNMGGVTAADGRYEYAGLTSGSYRVEAPGLPKTQPVQVELPPGKPFESVMFEASSDAEIRVEVRTPAGEPSSGLQVYGSMRPSDEDVKSAAARLPISAEPLGAGAYALKQLAPGAYEVHVTDGRNPTLRIPKESGATVEVRENDRIVLNVEYGGYEATISGRVVDGGGEPVDNVWVSAMHEGASQAMLQPHVRWAHGETRSLTDHDGTFELRGLAPSANYTVLVEQPIGGAATVKRGVAAGASIDVVMQAPARLSGVVVDAQGAAVPTFELQAVNTQSSMQSRELTENERGEWTLKDVPPGPLRLSVRSPAGAGDLQLDVKPGQSLNDLRIVLSPR